MDGAQGGDLRFPKDTGLALERIWQILPGRESEPAVLYCGVAPAALFVSQDNGHTWGLARGLHDHPHRARWNPGGGGLCLHTIIPHPTAEGRMLVAISTGGVYLTSDAGRTWRASNRGIRAEFLPDKHPEFGQCVHKVVRHPSRPDRFFLQNHWGLYRSDDGGSSWKDVANGVPSDFGFAMAMHPHDPDTVFIVPLESDQFRCPPGGRLRVYRTRDAGRSWRPLARGLPAGSSYDPVLRDALATDSNDPAGVYFGTRVAGSSPRRMGERRGGRSRTVFPASLALRQPCSAPARETPDPGEGRRSLGGLGAGFGRSLHPASRRGAGNRPPSTPRHFETSSRRASSRTIPAARSRTPCFYSRATC
jgi:hypothetical protein